MENNQVKLILRLVVGGYLVYLAYDLLKGDRSNWVFVAAAIVFGLAGAALAVHSLLALVRNGNSQSPKQEEGEEE